MNSSEPPKVERILRIDAWEQHKKGPGISQTKREHDPNDPRTWGNSCGRGFQYAENGNPVPAGTKGVRRRI